MPKEPRDQRPIKEERRLVRCPRHPRVVMNGIKGKERGHTRTCTVFVCGFCRVPLVRRWVREFDDSGNLTLDYDLKRFKGEILESGQFNLL